MAIVSCPRCAAPTRVVETRSIRRGGARRRRACEGESCGFRFTTREVWIDDAIGESSILAALEAATAAREQADKVIQALRPDGAGQGANNGSESD